jgi:hypothetical protein
VQIGAPSHLAYTRLPIHHLPVTVPTLVTQMQRTSIQTITRVIGNISAAGSLREFEFLSSKRFHKLLTMTIEIAGRIRWCCTTLTESHCIYTHRASQPGKQGCISSADYNNFLNVHEHLLTSTSGNVIDFHAKARKPQQQMPMQVINSIVSITVL